MTGALKRGEHVRVRLEGSSDDWTPAVVALVSDTNPSSVLLLFSGVVSSRGGLRSGGLPLSIDYTLESVTSLWGDSYEIEVADAASDR